MKLDHCHRASCAQIIEALRAKVEELTLINGLQCQSIAMLNGDLERVEKERDELLYIQRNANWDGYSGMGAMSAKVEYSRKQNIILGKALKELRKKYEELFSAQLLSSLQEKCAAKDAVIERLREELKHIASYNKNPAQAAFAALQIPNDDSALQERLAQERERCAKVCEECDTNHVYTNGSIKCAKALRSMK